MSFCVKEFNSSPQAIQVNGRKIIHLAHNWDGSAPSNACELFIKAIPKHLNENCILPHFQRFGKIYEFRLMMDFNEFNRGYGFVKYIKEEDAAKALQMMNHFFVEPKKCLEVQRSFDKCRLFVTNIPQDLSEEELENEFRHMFPKVEKIITHKRIINKNRNRGFLFLDFANHRDAVHVKKQTTPGKLRKWGRDLKIVWANSDRITSPDLKNIKTLFLSNIDITVKNEDLYAILVSYVRGTQIIKISRINKFAFIEFSCRCAAENILNNLKRYNLIGHSLSVEWVLPSSANSLLLLKAHDFDSVLKLKCISNYWSAPCIIFGRVFIHDRVQYMAIMIKEKSIARVYFMEIDTKELTDIQSRACEVVVTLIDKIGELPCYNFVIKVKNDIAYIVGFITNLEKALFSKAFNITNDLLLYWNEIKDLSISISSLCTYDECQIISMYENSILQKKNLPISLSVQHRLLFGINPLYRQKTSLQFNLNNTQVILCLIHASSYNNFIFPCEGSLYNFVDSGDETGNNAVEFIKIGLPSSSFTQSQNGKSTKFLKFASNIKI